MTVTRIDLQHAVAILTGKRDAPSLEQKGSRQNAPEKTERRRSETAVKCHLLLNGVMENLCKWMDFRFLPSFLRCIRTTGADGWTGEMACAPFFIIFRTEGMKGLLRQTGCESWQVTEKGNGGDGDGTRLSIRSDFQGQ